MTCSRRDPPLSGLVTANWKKNYGERVPKHMLLSKQLEEEKAKLKKLGEPAAVDQETLLHGIDGSYQACWEPQLSEVTARGRSPFAADSRTWGSKEPSIWLEQQMRIIRSGLLNE